MLPGIGRKRTDWESGTSSESESDGYPAPGQVPGRIGFRCWSYSCGARYLDLCDVGLGMIELGCFLMSFLGVFGSGVLERLVAGEQAS